ECETQEIVLGDRDRSAPGQLLANRLELGSGNPVDVRDADDARRCASRREVLDELFLVRGDVRHRSTSEVPHGGTHGPLPVRRLDVESTALQLADGPPNQGVEVA